MDSPAPCAFRRTLPLQLSTPLPNSSSAPQHVDKLKSRSPTHPHYGSHLVLRNALADSCVPAFAYNRHAAADGRGWVEPNPDNLPKRGGWVGVRSFPILLVQNVLAFSDRDMLRDSAVFVSRVWYAAIRESPELTSRRMAFVHSADYDGCGIVAYLATLSRATRTLLASGYDCGGRRFENVTNPALGHCPLVRLSCSSLAGSASTEGSLAALTAGRVAHFATEKLPFAWAGIDFGDFRVAVTKYTVGTSDQAGAPVPMQWELQGSNDRAAAWGDCTWVVLDKQQGAFVEQPAKRLSATFDVVLKSDSATYGGVPFRRLRIVQTSVNSHWGHELVVSGLEFYGRLFRCRRS